MRTDLALVLRGLFRAPLTPTVAAAALCVAVAVSAAIFTVVRGVLLRGLPYPESERLVLVWRSSAHDPMERGSMSPPDYLEVRERTRAFGAVAAVNSFGTTYLPENGDPEQVQLGVVAGSFFEVLGVRSRLGRALEPADDRPIDTRDSSAVGVIVLAHGFWERALDADPAVLGRTIDLGGIRSRIIGVMPQDFRLHMPSGAGLTSDVIGWTPLGIDYATAPRDGAYLKVLARLAPGATVQAAEAELTAASRRWRDEIGMHHEAGTRLRVVPLDQEVTAHIEPVLLLLSATGAMLLAVACANAASLLLVRFAGREQEVAVRRALGASDARVVRPMLLEAALVAFGGTAAGVLLANPAITALLALEPGIVPRTSSLTIDGGLVVMAAVLAMCLTLLCGLGPALIVARGRLATLLRSRRVTASAGATRARSGMLILQSAVAFALLYVSASLLGTLVRLERAELGFDHDRVLTARVTLPFVRYPGPDRWVTFFNDLQDRLAASGAVDAVALTSDLPTRGDLTLEPYALGNATDEWGAHTALYRIVSPGYFETLRVPLRAGRAFTAVDRLGSPDVVMVDEALAAALVRLEPGPIVGRRVTVTVHEFRAGYRVTRRTAEVVGVVGTVPHEHPDADPPGTIYMSHAQYPLWSLVLTVRGATTTPDVGVLRAALDGQDRLLPLSSVRPLRETVAETLAPTRFVLALIGIFAATVIVLTAAALYGLVSDTVRQRRRELAVRAALGAAPGVLTRRMLRGGLALAVLGIVPGMLVASVIGRLLARGVAGTVGVAPGAAAVAVVGLLAIAAVACVLPAWRAGRTNPMTTLREE